MDKHCFTLEKATEGGPGEGLQARFSAGTKVAASEGVNLGRRTHWCDRVIEMEGNIKHILELLKTTRMEFCKARTSSAGD